MPIVDYQHTVNLKQLKHLKTTVYLRAQIIC